jgi:hypothetical protein
LPQIRNLTKQGKIALRAGLATLAFACGVKHMENLNISLHKRNLDPYIFAFFCAAIGVWIMPEHSVSGWLVGSMVMGPACWFLFKGPKWLSQWSSFRCYIFRDWVSVFFRVTIFIVMLNYFSPYLITLLNGVVNA